MRHTCVGSDTFQGSNDTHDKEKLDACLENAMMEGFVVDGKCTYAYLYIKNSLSQKKKLDPTGI